MTLTPTLLGLTCFNNHSLFNVSPVYSSNLGPYIEGDSLRCVFTPDIEKGNIKAPVDIQEVNIKAKTTTTSIDVKRVW